MTKKITKLHPARKPVPTRKRPVSKVRPASSRSKASQPARTPRIIKHHAKLLYNATPRFVHGMIVGAFVGVIVVASLGMGRTATALSINTSEDCDAWSIIYCGVQSSGQLKNKYNDSKYVRSVFHYFTISSTDMSNIGSTAVKGTIYDNGTVKVSGTVVATNAITAARQRVTSKDKKITYNNATFFTRPIKLAWSHKSAPAYVVLKSGVFDYAVLAPCGNPIVATPKVAQTPQATPTPTTPTPTPTPTPTDTVNDSKPTPTTPTPKQQTPKVTSTPVETVASLPNTGPGAVFIVVALSVIGGTIFHRAHHHAKHKRRHRHYA